MHGFLSNFSCGFSWAIWSDFVFKFWKKKKPLTWEGQFQNTNSPTKHSRKFSVFPEFSFQWSSQNYVWHILTFWKLLQNTTPPIVIILCQPDLFLIFPVTILKKVSYRSFQNSIFLKDWNLTLWSMEKKLKPSSTHFFPTKRFLKINCDSPQKRYLLIFWNFKFKSCLKQHWNFR